MKTEKLLKKVSQLKPGYTSETMQEIKEFIEEIIGNGWRPARVYPSGPIVMCCFKDARNEELKLEL